MDKVRKPQPPKPKPVRYWPGKAPTQQETHDSSDDEGSDDGKGRKTDLSVLSSGPSQEPSVVVIESTRLKSLLQRKSEPTLATSDDQRKGKQADDEGEEDDSEDEMMKRRQRMKAMALRRQQMEKEEDEEAEEQLANIGGKAAEEEGDSESEYTTDDSEDEVSARVPLFKPVFIPKSHRETIIEKDRIAEEDEAAENLKAALAEQRKKESHDLVAEELLREMTTVSVTDGPPDVDDTDGLDEDSEYDAWKLRELQRIKRDREEQEAVEQEKLEIERRRNMTDAELIEENERVKPAKEKEKYSFLQKYYHKGAFFSDQEILNRDFNQPTLEDKFDKSVLPAVMQVKKFGKIGQTKWTHLTNEDTSIGDSAWFQKSDVNKRILSKMAGMEQSFQKPTKRARTG
ncbi:hypothetical protein HDU97_003865 [Phlyctochytrium planicorne]|nr:hypothetical protein HDU97_003865 [Phlyctochytrium planicorne]